MRETDELMNEIAKEVRELGGKFKYLEVLFAGGYSKMAGVYRIERGNIELEEWLIEMAFYVISDSLRSGNELVSYAIYG